MTILKNCGVCGKKVKEDGRITVKLQETNEVWQSFHIQCYDSIPDLGVTRNE